MKESASDNAERLTVLSTDVVIGQYPNVATSEDLEHFYKQLSQIKCDALVFVREGFRVDITSASSVIKEIKDTLSGRYEYPSGEPFMLEPGKVGSIMRIRSGSEIGLTDINEAIGHIVSGRWRRVSANEERAVLAKEI